MVKAAVKSKTAKLKIKLPPTENTEAKQKQVVHVGKQNLKPFRAGESGNPAGRPKGSRNKLAEAFVADMLADWEVAGQAAIQQVRLNDPSTYLRVMSGLVPKEYNLGLNREQSLEKFLEQFTDAQLEEFDRAVAAITAVPVQG